MVCNDYEPNNTRFHFRRVNHTGRYGRFHVTSMDEYGGSMVLTENHIHVQGG
jgi:hypothetical protein